MSAKIETLAKIKKKLRELREEESTSTQWVQKGWISVRKWLYLLAHEFIKDDVRVRAESLAYLMIFSLLPLVAGFFFLLSLFSEVGLVQEAIQNTLSKMLGQIPEVHRAFVLNYMMRFKELYLSSLLKKSSTLGIFSFSFLVWVGLKVYNNIDATLNHIWSSEMKRPFIEKIRNFIVVSAVSPIVLIVGISVPLMVKQVASRHALTAHLSPLLALLNAVAPSLLIFVALFTMYFYLPVEKVQKKSAFLGAVFSTLALQLTNECIQLYFRLGTETAYGKAAILPILGVWIYFAWLVVILGAEISYLVQHREEVLESAPWTPSFYECQGIARILAEVHERFYSAKGPSTDAHLLSLSRLDTQTLRNVVGILSKHKFLVQCVEPSDPERVYYGAARDLSQVTMDEILKLFFEKNIEFETDVEAGLWEQSLRAWLRVFEGKTLAEMARQSS